MKEENLESMKPITEEIDTDDCQEPPQQLCINHCHHQHPWEYIQQPHIHDCGHHREENALEEQPQWFVEQLISEKPKDLVTVEPDGGIRLSTYEQLSAQL